MTDILFLVVTGLILLAFLVWGFTYLPGERWQMLAVVPLRKDAFNRWKGINITYYGFFVATSQLISFALLLILLSSLKVTLTGAIIASLLVLAFSVPAARLVAMVVEKKRHTFTIAGASFVGIIIAPWAILVTAKALAGQGSHVVMPVIPMLAAMSIAYTLGEGLGRLGCISYGCCYGKPLKDSCAMIRLLFSRCSFIFYGDNKKVTYEAHLNGEKLVPIQAITCILYTLGALAGAWLFLAGCFTQSLLATMILTQVWRVVSETLRADFRGFAKVSVYQRMGLIGVFYTAVVSALAPETVAITPQVEDGLHFLWQPGVIIGLQALWLLFFYAFGKSTVTSATVSFELLRERI